MAVGLVGRPLFGLGQLDDLGVILLGLSLFIRLAPSELVAPVPRGDGTRGHATGRSGGSVGGPARTGAVRTTYRILESDEPPA